MQLRNLFRVIKGLPKTLYFNFHYLPFKQAIKLPIWVSSNIYCWDVKGHVKIDAPIQTAMIRIGFGGVGIFDPKYSRGIWQVTGDVIFHGKAHIGHGTRISVGGQLEVGKNFEITAESAIICHDKITFGDDVLISWQCQFMDTDFHSIYIDGKLKNQLQPITIGNRCWISSRCMILKGSSLADDCVLGGGSTLTHKFSQPHCLLVGSPAKIIRNNIVWTKENPIRAKNHL